MQLSTFLQRFSGDAKPQAQIEALLGALERRYGWSPNGDTLTVLKMGGTAHYTGQPPLRFMGLEEIVQAEEFLHVDFKTRGLLPLFDLYENDFICLRMESGTFCVFNIIDHSVIFDSETLSGILRKLGYRE